MTDYSESLIKLLIKKVKEYPRFSNEEIENFCWMGVHEHKHGVLPSEYDIREIDGKTPCLCSCTAIQQNFSISFFEKRGYSFTFLINNLMRDCE